LIVFRCKTKIVIIIDKSNSYSFDYQKNSYIFIGASRGREIPSRRRVHPRTRAGGGARWIQVPALAGTQETMGGAGVERSGTESSGKVSPFLLQVSNTSTTKEGDLKSS